MTVREHIGSQKSLQWSRVTLIMLATRVAFKPHSFLVGVFPDSSVGKESACNAGDPSSFPGSGRSPGEGIGYLLQYSWASLVAQLVKNLPSMWQT